MFVYTERNKKSVQVREMLRLDPFSLVINKHSLKWSGYVTCKGDADGVKAVDDGDRWDI